jgi:hypothetical protein
LQKTTREKSLFHFIQKKISIELKNYYSSENQENLSYC